MILTVRDSKYGIKDYDLDKLGKSNYTFGRLAECDIILRSSFVSRPHGIVFKENGEWFLQDMQSTYGTYYMKRKIEKIPVKDGMVVKIYSEEPDDRHCVELRFHDSATEQGYGQLQNAAEAASSYSDADSGSYGDNSGSGFGDGYSSNESGASYGKSYDYQAAEYDAREYSDSKVFALIALIAGFLSLPSAFLISKTGSWLPILLAGTAVTFALLTLILKKAGSGLAKLGLIFGGIALIFAVYVTICVGTLGTFNWAYEGRSIPFYKFFSKIFDSSKYRWYDKGMDYVEKGKDYLEDLLGN